MTPHRPASDETLETLAERLRRLPPPPVPAGLEGRLLADMPPRRRSLRLRSRFAAALLLAAAAAALLAVRLPQRAPAPAAPVTPPADDVATLWRYEQAMRGPDADPIMAVGPAAPFEWPISGAGPSLLSDRLSEPTQ